MWCYIDKYGRHELERRSDLANEKHQGVISSAVEDRRWFECGCASGIKLWLIPFELSGGRFGLRRYRKTDRHKKGCFAEALEAIFETEGETETVVYTENMLMDDDDPDRKLFSGTGARKKRASGSQYGDFTHFFQAMFTRASLETFSITNAGKTYRDTGLVNPSPAMVFLRLAEIFNEPLLGQGRISLAAALEKIGRRVCWGVSDKPLVRESDNQLRDDEVLRFQIGPHWECKGAQSAGALLEISRKVLSRSRGKAKAMRHVIPPPYLYSAVSKASDGKNNVAHFFRIPVSVQENCIFALESEAERRCIQTLSGAGVAFLKLHVQGDLSALGSEFWPFRTDEKGRLPSRPDVIAFMDGKVRIVYITDSTDPKYLEGVTQSIEIMEDFLATPEVCVRKVAAESFLDGSWRELLA